nr:potassium transporter Kup [Verticiella sp. GG226]
MYALVVGAIGIVYGDIGTSVLYAFKEIFAIGHVAVTPDNVFGLLSLLFWTLTIIVSVKYVVLILRADNRGEGGMVAMLALASRAVQDKPRLRQGLLAIGIFGTALFYGDGVITPAISVLSAVEGLELITPHSRHWVLPITVVVITALFAIQKHGTAGIGKFFGPIMVLWFATIGALGLVEILHSPQILHSLDPRYALNFVLARPLLSFIVLSALILCVTGAEALYADMGHFGRRPIRVAWFSLVMPALTLNYFGQGALLLRNPQAAENPFYLLAPSWLLAPMVILATLATIIASQALISGAFSITKQVIQLGYLPRLRVVHTSADQVGQVYMPAVNWSLYVAILLAVGTFKTSGALAAAYGIAVCGLMFITTVLTYFVVRYHWKLPFVLCVAVTGVFLLVDLAFLSSATLKIIHGGWFPILIALLLFMAMQTWRRGQEVLRHTQAGLAVDLEPLIASIFVHPPARVPGTAVFLASNPAKAPAAFLHNLKHNKVLHEQNVFVTVHYHEVPWVPEEKRAHMRSLGNDCWQISLHYGFKDDPDVPRDLAAIETRDFGLDPMETSYFLGRDQIVATRTPGGMAPWRRQLFAQMHRNASAMSDFLKLPGNAVVELGAKIDV